MAVLVLEFFVTASVEHLMLGLSRSGREQLPRKKALRIGRYSKRALAILGVRVDYDRNTRPFPGGGMMVCNHVSYLDILVLSSQIPALYITSVETGSAGWIGALCRLAGCLFVERRKVTALKKEVSEIDSALKNGVPVVLFPEATSSDGRDVLPFRSSLYECALQARAPIHSFCIHYTPEDNGVPYYGEMTILPHLFAICDGRSRTAHLEFLDTIEPSDTLERKAAARTTRFQIRQAYVSRMGRAPEDQVRPESALQA